MGRLEEAKVEIAVIRKLDPSVCLALYRERSRYEKVEDPGPLSSRSAQGGIAGRRNLSML